MAMTRHEPQRRGTGPLCPPPRAARGGRRRPGEAAAPPGCWWWAPAGWAARCRCIWPRPGSAPSGIVDDDTVSLSNLQRQIAHRTADVGRPKIDSARDARCAPSIPVSRSNAHPVRLTAANALDADRALRHRRRRLGQFRHPLSAQRRLLLRARSTLVSAAVTEFDGQLATFKAHDTSRPIPAIAACFPRRRRRAPRRPVRRPACWAPPPA